MLNALADSTFQLNMPLATEKNNITPSPILMMNLPLLVPKIASQFGALFDSESSVKNDKSDQSSSVDSEEQRSCSFEDMFAATAAEFGGFCFPTYNTHQWQNNREEFAYSMRNRDAEYSSMSSGDEDEGKSQVSEGMFHLYYVMH